MREPVGYYEVCVGDEVREVRFSRQDADRLALDIACDELVTVEVNPVRHGADRKGARRAKEDLCSLCGEVFKPAYYNGYCCANCGNC